jgi:chorismate dehydratase
MRVGLVKSLNARPLTWGFEQDSKVVKIYDTPKVLNEMLLNGDLDTALISSVECLRHQDKLSFSLSCGVCAKTKVRSILFFLKRSEEENLERVFVEEGSRTSVALLDLMLFKKYNRRIDLIPSTPEELMSILKSNLGSCLLFGDSALLAEWDESIYISIDMAEWWNQLTGKYFIFALWAYPKEKWIPDSFFIQSLEFGLANIQDIIEKEKRFPAKFTYNYLMNELHYKPEAKNYQGFLEFEIDLRNYGIL